jgi:hypothetical protein
MKGSVVPWTISAVLAVVCIVLLFKKQAPQTAADQTLNQEVTKLRAELKELREKASPAAEKPVADKKALQLTIALGKGHTNAIEGLNSLAEAAREQTLREGKDAPASAELLSAFTLLGRNAGQGDQSAFVGLWRSMRKPALQNYAAEGLSIAAAGGHEQALAILLDGENFGMSKLTAVNALRHVADAGNEKAIAILTTAAKDSENPKQLRILATAGLHKAAGNGNTNAIDTLGDLAKSEVLELREPARRGLEAAGLNKQERALEILKNLPATRSRTQ